MQLEGALHHTDGCITSLNVQRQRIIHIMHLLYSFVHAMMREHPFALYSMGTISGIPCVCHHIADSLTLLLPIPWMVAAIVQQHMPNYPGVGHHNMVCIMLMN